MFNVLLFFLLAKNDLSSHSPCFSVPLQPNSGELDPLYVVEVLLHCSRESLKNSATEAAKPVKPDEKGEMQVSIV